MTLKEYIKMQEPINTTEKVDYILLFIKKNRIFFDKSTDYEIRLAIKRLSIQKYYVENRPDFDYRPSHNDSESPAIHFGKTKRAQLELMRDELKHNGKNKKKLINKLLDNGQTKADAKRARNSKKKKHETIDYSLVGGKRYAPAWALKKLAQNGRDYSYRHPTIENAIKRATNRTKEQQETFESKHKPHIIYTPMGGQNKKY